MLANSLLLITAAIWGLGFVAQVVGMNYLVTLRLYWCAVFARCCEFVALGDFFLLPQLVAPVFIADGVHWILGAWDNSVRCRFAPAGWDCLLECL